MGSHFSTAYSEFFRVLSKLVPTQECVSYKSTFIWLLTEWEHTQHRGITLPSLDGSPRSVRRGEVEHVYWIRYTEYCRSLAWNGRST